MSEEFDSSKDSYPTKFEWRPRILIKLNLRELCYSKLSGWCILKSMTISLSQRRGKFRQVGCKLMRHQAWVIFVTLTENSSVETNEMKSLEMRAAETHFNVRYGTKTTPEFLSFDGEGSLLLLPRLVSLLSGGIMQPEKIFPSILKAVRIKTPKKVKHHH